MPAKWALIHTSVSSLLNAAISGHSVPVRQVAAVLGRLVSIRRSHGSVVTILSRSLQHQLGLHVFHHGWVGSISLVHSSVRELTLLLVYAPSFEGRPIPTTAAASHCYDFSLLRGVPAAVLPPPLPSFALLANGTWSVLSVPENCSVELNLVLSVLTRDRVHLTAEAICIVYWTTTSWPVLQLLRCGAASPVIQDLLFSIRRLERDLSLHFVPIWVPTRPPPSLLLSVSARLSYSTDEWAVHRSDLAAVFSAMSFLPTLDCFASHLNAVCSDFYSLLPCPGSLGVDFYAQLLLLDRSLFLCPPVRQIACVFRRLTNSPPIPFLLDVPDWSSAAYWSVLHPAG